MKHNYLAQLAATAGRYKVLGGLLLGSLLPGPGTTARAQAPAWALALVPGTRVVSAGLYNYSYVNAVATDASGNVFVTGSFNGAVAFGSTTLTSVGNTDIFLAKYVPSTGTWAWAVRVGGTAVDEGTGVAVSGNNVYLTGYIDNSSSNSSAVTLQSNTTTAGTTTQLGTSSAFSYDLLVAKYTDQGSSATLAWSQVAGGTGDDRGQGIAVSGTSVYVTGTIYNNRLNDNTVVFGGSGTTLGTVGQLGASASNASADIVLAKYTDNGSSATPTWTHVGGGTSGESGSAVAVSGTSVYVTGTLVNTTTNASNVVFGGTGSVAGTVPQLGATSTSSTDLVLAKYTDNGATGTFGWSQIGGGTDYDFGIGVAASGPNVYMTGFLLNNTSNAKGVLFGGSGTTVGTTTQLGASSATVTNFILAKYVDNGSSGTLGWTQVGGGTGSANSGHSVLASGNAVYVTGNATNDRINSSNVVFGGTGTTPSTYALTGTNQYSSADLLVIRYTDNGPTATINWAKLGGGSGYNVGFGLAASGTRLYVVGNITAPGTFGSLTTSGGSGGNTGFLGALDLAGTPTATLPAAAASPRLYPNPAAGPATLSGASAGAAVSIFDALGRRVATATADARGTAALPGGLCPGVYVVRAGTSTARWVVE